MVQTVIVILVVAGSLLYAIRRVRNALHQPQDPCAGCAGCELRNRQPDGNKPCGRELEAL